MIHFQHSFFFTNPARFLVQLGHIPAPDTDTARSITLFSGKQRLLNVQWFPFVECLGLNS